MTDQSLPLAADEAATIARDELLNAAHGPAVRAAVEMRIEQIAEHGHTREADSDLPLDHLPREMQRRVAAAVDRIRGTGERRNLPAARLALVRAVAMGLAAIDRLDLVLKREN